MLDVIGEFYGLLDSHTDGEDIDIAKVRKIGMAYAKELAPKLGGA